MINKKMAFRLCKASVIIFVLCFAVVHLASIVKKDKGQENGDLPHHLQREDSDQGLAVPPGDKLGGDVHNIPGQQLMQQNIDSDLNKHDEEVVNNKHDAQDSNLEFDKKDEAGVPDDIEDEQLKQPQLEKPARENPPLIVPEVNVNNGQDSQIEEPKQDRQEAVEQPKKDDDDDDGQDGNGDDDDDDDDDDEDDEEGEDKEFPAHKLMDKLSLKDLQPPDHMDAVRIEQDGHLNKDYKKEIILGNHEEFEQQPDIDPEDLLTQIFDKVDKDHDNFISLIELEEWIIDKVQEHFSEAREEATRIFKHLDSENKGKISWQNFHIHFLVAKGHDLKKAQKHAADYETIALDPDDKERLIRYKFRWAEADEEPQDNVLTLEEFMAFRHPEQSKLMLDRMVQDILDSLDSDNDNEVTEDEFVALPPGEVDGFADSDKAWQEERRKEFRMVIDINHDGKVNREELKNYVDPQNPNHGRLEADNLIQLADQNGDDKLSLDEVLNNPELFLGSKMVDTGRNFHDEF